MAGIFTHKLLATVLLALALVLAACGGGSARVNARLTTANARDFANAVASSYYTTGLFWNFVGRNAGRHAGNPGVGSMQKAIGIVLKMALNKARGNTNQARIINTTEACTDGGSVSITGNVDDASHTGTLTFAMSYCIENGVIMNGKVTVAITTNTYSHLAATMAFADFYIDDGIDSLVLRGFQNINATNTRVTTTSHLTYTLNTTVRIEQAALVVTETGAGVTTSGTICITGQGCVIVETVEPVQLDVYDYPVSGEIILHGNNSNIRLRIADGHIDIKLDTDGDGAFETPITSSIQP